MKTQKTNSLKEITKIAFLITLLFTTVSCKSQDSKNGSSSASQTKGKPQIDIHTAVMTNNLEAIRQHIAAGSDLNEKDPYGGSSPLISAALFDKREIASALIGAGADINFRNNDGSTALITASFFCRPEIVKMLLDKGADKTIKNKYGSTAYETVAGTFSGVKSTYDMMGKMLGPMGLKLDYPYIEATRPQLAAILK